MYSDPAKLRIHTIKIRLSDEEHRLIQALVDYTGEQTAPLLREMLLDQAASLLGVETTGNVVYMSGQHPALTGT